MLKTGAATVFLCACFSVCNVASAQPVPLSGQALSEMIGGAVVELDTPIGTRLPITYGEDGRMSGRAGAISFYLGASTDSGRWWVSGDMLCQKWERWFDAETQCMRIRKEGARIHWTSRDGKTGTGTVHVKIAAVPNPPASRAAQVVASAPVAAVVPSKETATREPAKSSVSQMPMPARLGGAAPASEPVAKEPTAPAQAVPQFSRPVVTIAKPTAAVQRVEPASEQEAKPAVTEAPAITRPAPVVKPTVPRVTKPAVPRFMVVKVAAADVLNVRQGPSAEHEVVGAIPPQGRGVEITGDCREMWCPVRHANVAGWVNRMFLESEAAAPVVVVRSDVKLRDNPEAPRNCLKPAARELLARIEAHFGPMELVSTCRAGARIAGSGRPSKHSDGNAIDFKAGARKHQVLAWLIVNHRAGGTMTYRGMEHIHVDIGPHFVALDSGRGGSQRMARQ